MGGVFNPDFLSEPGLVSVLLNVFREKNAYQAAGTLGHKIASIA